MLLKIRVVAGLVLLVAVVDCGGPGSMKVFLNGGYRAGIRYSEWHKPLNESVEVGSMEEDLVRYEDVKDWEHEKFRKADQVPEGIPNALPVAVTPEHPYTVQFSDETEYVWVSVWVTSLHDKEKKWKEFFTDKFQKEGMRCYSLEGTADSPTWRLFTGQEMPGCSN